MICYSQVDFLHHYGFHVPVRINLQCYCIMLTILTFQACSIHLQFMLIHKTLMPSTSIALYFTLLTTQPIFFLSKEVGICNTTNHQDATMHHDHGPPHSCSLKMCILSKLVIGKTLGQHFQYFMLEPFKVNNTQYSSAYSNQYISITCNYEMLANLPFHHGDHSVNSTSSPTNQVQIKF